MTIVRAFWAPSIAYSSSVGFLDKAKKLARQAIDKAEDAVADVRNRVPGSDPPPREGAGDVQQGTSTGPAEYGTPYRPGMLGRPGWREKGLVDPAAVLPISERRQAGVPQSVKSAILDAGFGMGRRWSAGDTSLGLFYQLYPEHEQSAPLAGAGYASLPDGTELTLVAHGGRRVVLEARGINAATREHLRLVVATKLAENPSL